MFKRVLLVLVLVGGGVAGNLLLTPAKPAEFTCPVTLPDPSIQPSEEIRDDLFGWRDNYVGNDVLLTTVPPDGVLPISPAQADKDGVLWDKWGWYRLGKGQLAIEGTRLDAEAPPMLALIPEGYGDTGFQSSGIGFPSEGCWQVTGTLSGQALSFVMQVQLIKADAGESPVSKAQSALSRICPVTEPEWLLAPDDAAVQGPPAYGYYYVNEDHTIWASAWWSKTGEAAYHLRAGQDSKMGWFRPAGADLQITGERLDGQAPPLEADVPCCYPTRFQATGLYFPTEGCWEVTATAAGSSLAFVVRVYP